MGDLDFEQYLNDNRGDSSPDNPFPNCHKRLLFDIIALKISNGTNLMKIYANLHVNFPNTLRYESIFNSLNEKQGEDLTQLDYLMSTILDDFNVKDDGEPGVE